MVEAFRVCLACFSAAKRKARKKRGPSLTAGREAEDFLRGSSCPLRLNDFCVLFTIFPRLFFLAPHQQIRANKRLQASIKDAVDVADLQLGAMILDHAV